MSEPFWSALGGQSADWEGVWAAGTAYVPGDVVTYNGINYLAVNPSTGVVPAGGVASDIGTVLPSSPFDGQEFTLVDSLTAPTFAWKFRYMAAKATNKWLFVGGAPRFAEVTTPETTASATYVALATAGPSLAVPVVGDYLVGIGFANWSQATTQGLPYMSYDIGGTPASDVDAVLSVSLSGTLANYAHGVRLTRKLSLPAVTLIAKYKTSAGTSGFGNRTMSVEPIAVGG